MPEFSRAFATSLLLPAQHRLPLVLQRYLTSMQSDCLLTLKLPQGYAFADLKLRRSADEAIDLDMDLVALVCKINGLDFDKVQQDPGPVVTSILTVWYKTHLPECGEPDAVMDVLRRQPPALHS